MLDGDLFVGFSRSGSVFVCSDWRKAIRDQAGLVANSSLIECKSDGSSFDLGGWLSVQNHHVMFEIQDRIYVVALDDRNRIQNVKSPPRASYSLLTSSAPQLAVPVSFMTLCDDAIMTTYTVCISSLFPPLLPLYNMANPSYPILDPRLETIPTKYSRQRSPA